MVDQQQQVVIHPRKRTRKSTFNDESRKMRKEYKKRCAERELVGPLRLSNRMTWRINNLGADFSPPHPCRLDLFGQVKVVYRETAPLNQRAYF
jgi:hypothetical protein